jgi:hypothetical protein
MHQHAYFLNTQEVEAEELQSEGQPGLHSEFQANLSSIARPCLKNKQKVI